jgi:hypothetical protein
MPGTFVVQADRTFSTMLLMASAPKMKFQTTEQDVSAAGERKWEIQVAAAWFPEYDMRPVSEVISVTLLGGTDPAGDITPGSPVEFDTLRVGISPVERTDRGVRGGKAYYQASGIRVASVSSLRPLKSEAS